MGNSTGQLKFLRRRKQSKEFSKFSELENRLQDQSETLKCLPLDFLKAITGDFSKEQELGRGEFGVVYKGVLQNGKVIAVKMLSEMDLHEFQKEVNYRFSLKHKNIVKLVGYCAESQCEPAEIDGKYVMAEVRKRLLCYEYTNNKSLDNYISTTEPYGLGWHMRYEIIRGICHGLHYLHTKCQTVHMYLNPHNILLDDNMEPKIADFIMENGRETVYMAPEYLADRLVSEKADIFSLGVIIIELMTGLRDYPSNEESYEHFVENVIGSWSKRLKLEEAGRNKKPLGYYVDQVKACILMGLMCANADPIKRPTILYILEELTEADVTSMKNWSLEKKLVHFDVGFTADLEDLLRASAEVLGKGTHGMVYKATLENRTVVAIRRFSKTTKDPKDFMAEVAVLGKIRHPSLVPPIACYAAQDEKLIVIDYLPRGSLSAFLHDRDMSTPSNWATRMKIVKGIARGLTCLHDKSIIHGNLTARNVLLDKHFHPKVVDFGLFRLLTPAVAAPDLGYHAPELSNSMDASTKSDVYSLGVIILELLTGELPSSMYLPGWLTREEWSSNMFDQDLMQDENTRPSGDQLNGVLMLALECVDPSPSARPQAREVLLKLAKICPGPKNAARRSKDRSWSLELEALDDQERFQACEEIGGADAGSSEDDLSLSVRIRAKGVLEPQQKPTILVEQEVLEHILPGPKDTQESSEQPPGQIRWRSEEEARLSEDGLRIETQEVAEEISSKSRDRAVVQQLEHCDQSSSEWRQQQSADLFQICSGSKIAARPSEDRSRSLELEALEEQERFPVWDELDGADAGQISEDDLFLSMRINGTGLLEPEQKPSLEVLEYILSGAEDAQEKSWEQPPEQIRLRPEDEAVLSEDGPRIVTHEVPDQTSYISGVREVAQQQEHIHVIGDVEQSPSEWRQQQPADIFQGVHKDGEKIAVKMLYDMPGLDEQQFLNEFYNLSRLQHPNIVRLVGYCHETRKTYVKHNGRLVFAERIRMALCFEYMHFGSLDKYLSDECNGLDWNVRYTLIKGICKGMKYLHEELRSPIYHLDLKPANILLDENMLPKIADFGLSRLFADERSRITRSSIGTLGYLPPEYIQSNIISNKFDIFSLGVVIIKIMTGPTGYNRSANMSPQEFVELAHDNWMKRLKTAPMNLFESYSKQVKKCMEIALSSVVANRYKRPTIGDIVRKLDDTD